MLGRTLQFQALALIASCTLIEACKREEAPADCGVIRDWWVPLATGHGADEAVALHPFELCQRAGLPKSFERCLQGVQDYQVGKACFDALPEPIRAELRAAEEAALAAAKEVADAAATVETKMRWREPRPAGALYLSRMYEPPIVVTADGKPSVLSLPGSSQVRIASNDVAFAGTTGAQLRLHQLEGAKAKALPSIGKRVAHFAIDADSDRVVVAFSDESGGRRSLATFENGRWTTREIEPAIGQTKAVARDSGGAIWVLGSSGVARLAGEQWASLGLPEPTTCILTCALAKAGERIVLQSKSLDRFTDFTYEGERWKTYTNGGLEWSSEGWGSNGAELLSAKDTYLRLRDDAMNDVGVSTPFRWDLRMALDGRGRVWTTANDGLAVVDGRSEKITMYPQGARGGLFRSAGADFVVVGGGPELPAMPETGRARSVGTTVKVNGTLLSSANLRFCPSMPGDPGSSNPCEYSQPSFEVVTDANGAFTLEDVPHGSYDLAFMARTSDGRTQWAVVHGALDVRAGGAARLRPIDLSLRELTLP